MYNIETEKVRKTHLRPYLNWGGPGLLGAEISAGLGHRLPLRKID